VTTAPAFFGGRRITNGNVCLTPFSCSASEGLHPHRASRNSSSLKNKERCTNYTRDPVQVKSCSVRSACMHMASSMHAASAVMGAPPPNSHALLDLLLARSSASRASICLPFGRSKGPCAMLGSKTLAGCPQPVRQDWHCSAPKGYYIYLQ